MATKKGLADLLREEVKKSPDFEPDNKKAGEKKITASSDAKDEAITAPPSTKAAAKTTDQTPPSTKAKAAQAKGTGSTSRTGRRTTKTTARTSTTARRQAAGATPAASATAKATTAKPSAPPATGAKTAGRNKTTSRQTHRTTATAKSTAATQSTAAGTATAKLERQVAALQQELSIAKQQEVNLSGQVKKLEVALSDHQAAVKALQQMDKLKQELEQTKKDALKLAKENQRLQKQLASQPAKPVETKKVATAIVPAAAQPRYRSLPSRPVMPDRASAQQGKNSITLETWCFD